MGHLRQPFISKQASVISKWGRTSYFKEAQCLIESRQKWAVTSKSGKVLFQSMAVISKWGSYFKVGHSTAYFKSQLFHVLIGLVEIEI